MATEQTPAAEAQAPATAQPEQPEATEQPEAAGDAKQAPRTRKAAAAKQAPVEQPGQPEQPPAAGDDPARPLTKDEKRELAAAVVGHVAKMLDGSGRALKGLPRDTAVKQVAAWMSYLPAGDVWPAQLGDRPTRK